MRRRPNWPLILILLMTLGFWGALFKVAFG